MAFNFELCYQICGDKLLLNLERFFLILNYISYIYFRKKVSPFTTLTTLVDKQINTTPNNAHTQP